MAASLSFQDAKAAGSAPTSISFTVASAAGQERLVALASIVNASWDTQTLGSVTIDGQAATQVGSFVRASDTAGHASGTNGAVLSFWRASGTSNTSISVAFSVTAGTIFDVRGAVWTLSNAGSLFASTALAINQPVSGGAEALNVNTVANGTVAAAILTYNSNTHATTWTGLTERFDGGNLYGNDWFSVADADQGSASTPLTVTATVPTDYNLGATQTFVGLSVSFNPAATGTTLTAAAGSYAETGASAGLARGQVAPAGSYALTGSAAGFVVAAGNVVLTAGPGSYNLSGSTAAFPGYEAPPPTGGGYTGGASRGRMIRRFRKKEDIEEIVERIEAAAALPPPPPPAPPLSAQPPLIDLMPRMQAAGIPAKTRIAVKQAVEDDDDDEAIELLLNLLS